MNFYAPYRKFKARVGEYTFYFPQGKLFIDDKAKIKALKKIPEEMGQIRDQDGNVVNRRTIKRTKKKGVPDAGDRQTKA